MKVLRLCLSVVVSMSFFGVLCSALAVFISIFFKIAGLGIISLGVSQFSVG